MSFFKKRWFIIPTTIILSIVLIWLLGSLYLLGQSNNNIFIPERSHNISLNEKYEQVFTRDSSGKNIDMWWLPNSSTKEVVLYIHGNIGRVPEYFPFLSRNYNVLAPSYQGYGLSEGSPSPEGTYNMAEVAYKWLLDKGFPPEKITVFGHSLGGSSAVYLAGKNPNIKKLIIVNSFDSVISMCSRTYYIFCVFGGNIFNTAENAKKVTVPVRQFNYTKDEIVPFENGKKLYEYFTSSKDKKFIELTGQTHTIFDMQLVFTS